MERIIILNGRRIAFHHLLYIVIFVRSVRYVLKDFPFYSSVICRQRYSRNVVKQRAQFIKEIKQHELTQSFALHGVRLHRIFTNPICKPISDEQIVKLTPKEQMRLDQLLNE